MTLKEVIEYWELFNAEIDDLCFCIAATELVQKP